MSRTCEYETWVINKAEEKTLETMEMWCYSAGEDKLDGRKD